jgi:LuxR family maltose regulon positive regulatory protein
VAPIDAMKARLWVVQRTLADATNWVDQRGLSIDDPLSYMREFEHITLARVLMARHNGETDAANPALRLLARLSAAAYAGGRTAAVIETLVLEALAHQALGNLRGAREPLERALVLAEPEGYLRVFVDEGTRMRDLLRHALARGIAAPYVQRVLSAFAQPAPSLPSAGSGQATAPAIPLTSRELDMLRLIAAGLRNQEIAEHLSISAATVKRHIANCYAKLGVTHRTEALLRANALKLL